MDNSNFVDLPDDIEAKLKEEQDRATYERLKARFEP